MQIGRLILCLAALAALSAYTFDRQITVSLAPGLYYATVGDFTTPGLNARDAAVTSVLTLRTAGPAGA